MITDRKHRNRLDASYSGTPKWLEILYEDFAYTLYRILREEDTNFTMSNEK
jgi:hypothetical protein